MTQFHKKTIFAKSFFIHVWHGSTYAYDIDHVSAFLLVGEPLALDKLLRRREKFAKGGFSIQGIISLLLKYFVFHVIF